VERVRNFLKKINISCEIRENEPMSLHTTFRVGGPADVYVRPRNVAELREVLLEAKAEELPVFVLGGGANILVSDRGIRGITVDLGRLDGCSVEGRILTARAGIPVSDAAEKAADAGLAGLDFIYAMPGSVGGAVWMNARCYDFSVSDVLDSVRYLDEDLEVRIMKREDQLFSEGFAYERSPFQVRPWIVIEASFGLRPAEGAGEMEKIRGNMERIKRDRTEKGHFLAPSAGSVFKNDRSFGAPSGVIIDRLGLRGCSIGGARISPLHANIILNSGGATASDIRKLVDFVRERVLEEFGYSLDPEILFVGDWG